MANDDNDESSDSSDGGNGNENNNTNETNETNQASVINQVKTFKADCPNISRQFVPGTGSLITVPKNEEKETRQKKKN